MWKTILGVDIALRYILQPTLTKWLAGDANSNKKKTSIARKVNKQFMFNFIFATIAVLVVRENPFHWQTSIVFIFGVLNSLAAYASWQAAAISLSKTSLLTILDDITGITLALVILGEAELLTKLLVFLGVLCFLSVLGFGVLSSKHIKDKKNEEGTRNNWKALLGWVATYSFIQGSAIFLMRYLPVIHDMSFSSFVYGQYAGSLLGSFILMTVMKKSDIRNKLRLRLTRSEWWGVFVHSMNVFLLLFMGLWVRSSIEVVIVQPIYLVGEMTLPVLIGLYIFREKDRATILKKSGPLGQAVFIAALIAAALIITLF